jgi:hypothetical protein
MRGHDVRAMAARAGWHFAQVDVSKRTAHSDEMALVRLPFLSQLVSIAPLMLPAHE